MISAAASAAGEGAEKTLALEADARALAETQRKLVRAPRLMTRFLAPPSVANALKLAHKHLAGVPNGRTALPKAAEWFLDNYYLIRRVARQVEEELPRGFVRHLPQLASGKSKGALRVDALARAFVARSRIELDAAELQRFLTAYQEVSPLTIAELWALPTLLRASVLQHLLALLVALHVPILARDHLAANRNDAAEKAPVQALPLDPSAGVERSIHALRLLDSIDWKSLFEKCNRTEAILKKDPAQIYPRMDFETCDSYRKVVETIAWDTGYAEEEVAQLAIRLAAEGKDDERRGHVGFYLVAAGRNELEARLGYRPFGLDRVRRFCVTWPTRAYLIPLALLTLLPLALAGSALTEKYGHPLLMLLAMLLAALPFSLCAAAFLQTIFAHLLSPRTLPKLDFTKAVPDNARTLVVMPTLLGHVEEIEDLTRQLELHYLSNTDPNLQFALLTDELDSKQMPDNRALIAAAAKAITALNARHSSNGKPGPFHLLHRELRWNESEGVFMGWERKRGKLDELNRLLRGDTNTSYTTQIGDKEALSNIRFVITLDTDTQLPMGAARKLIGLLAHPLNHAVFDEKTGRVTAGYTIVQPRVETSPASSRQTRFSRIFAGDIGFDIYTHAVSELYQDLFGSGIYVGKGIYDVDAFIRSTEGRAPENALVSHDLFEGIHGRAALATDVVLFEEYPASYVAYAKRMHRWVRGDWQIAPWLFRSVPGAENTRLPNRLSRIDRWKILDNLRRSFTGPLTLLLLALGLTLLPGSPAVWMLAALGIFIGPLLPGIILGGRMRMETLARAALAIVFLAYESATVIDAVIRVVVRMRFTRRGLLQWTTAAQTARGIAKSSPRKLAWETLFSSGVVAFVLGFVIALVHPAALLPALPLLAIWLLAPEIALWISAPLESREAPLRPEQEKTLRLLARRTWRFFEAFVGPTDQWLPVDNYQEEPNEQTAHRTSPTNIGLMLVTTLSAYDFGYIGPGELSLRVRSAFDTIARLQHYQGHLLNWYETRSLQPLLPKYVSTVDSGNFAGCLLALKHGCAEMLATPVLREASWRGLSDAVDLVDQAIVLVIEHFRRPGKASDVTSDRRRSHNQAPRNSINALHAVVARMRQAVQHGRTHLEDSPATLRLLGVELFDELERDLHEFLAGENRRLEAEVLHELRIAIESFKQQLQQLQTELQTLLPWLSLQVEARALGIVLPLQLRLEEIPESAEKLRAQLQQILAGRGAAGDASGHPFDAPAKLLENAFKSAAESANKLQAELLALVKRAEDEVRGMDFRLLYDGERKLFRIGYNATLDQADTHYYDLLASEARLASYLAIVKRDVPVSHWYALGRPMSRISGAPALLSWGGTMFEYLMPGLLMRSQPGTLLETTCERVVDAQISYGRKNREPWGVSESAYARLDAQQTYQYRSFGVPGLGFKRGLEEDSVVTPYASLLAVSIRPHDVVENVGRLKLLGMMGTYGLFEALDMTPGRTENGTASNIVRSYMAHHQGMLLVSIGNLLNARSMVDRFHASPLVETGEVLLNEHAPDSAPREWPEAKASELPELSMQELPQLPGPWSGNDLSKPQATVLSNGRLTTLLTDSGGGGLYWQGLALTRFDPDPTRDDQGIWIYLRDEQSQRVWPATSAEGRTTFAMHRAEFHRRDEGISVHVEVCVAPADDVEIRQVTLHNETDRARRFTVTTAGRPVLFDQKQAKSHPAFSSMFVETERASELEGLLFSRRPQSTDEDTAVMVHRLVRDGNAVALSGSETDRSAFHGRLARPDLPQALAPNKAPIHGRVGAVIDPIMSLSASVELKAKGSVTLAFVTAIGRSRASAIELARKYGSLHSVRWAFRDAESEGARRLQRNRLEPELLPAIQKLYSALLFADPSLRSRSDGALSERPNQRRLWARGISGDDPILLVKVSDPAAQIVAECLSAQRYLRSCGVRFDLAFIDEQATGYLTEGSGTLRSVLQQNEADEWLNRHGGVFVIAADQIPSEERRHLESAARVVFDSKDVSLTARMNRPSEAAPKLPRFQPTLNDEPMEKPQPKAKVMFDNGLGGFSEDGREYLISVKPGYPTPAPWANVLANAGFGCMTSESSLGMSWSLNSGENRLTPWRNDPVFDTPSEALYLRDEETSAIFSPTPLPAGRDGETLVRHGAGYTTYCRESHGLVQELTIFVPPDAPLKVARLRIRNTLPRHRRLTATYYAEWVLGARRETQRAYITSEFDRSNSALLATCKWNSEFGDRVAFLASKEKVHGFTTDRGEFLGLRGNYERPDALKRWGMSGSIAAGADPCAAIQVHLELAANEETETHFILGEAESREAAAQLIARYRDGVQVERSFTDLGHFWDNILGAVQVKTPEPSMDLMLNRWLLYQALAARIFGRTGFYQSSGAFGFRDQLQDVMALLHSSPERTRAHILESASHQFEEGDVLHWWHPPSGRGVRTRCSDDLAWLPYVTAEYVQATGDTGILREQVTLLKAEPLKPEEKDRYAEYAHSTETIPLMEHCRRALEHAVTEGVHGLPLMGDGDWNDGMNRIGIEGRGESVWLGWFLCATMDRFSALAARMQDSVEAARWRDRSESLRARLRLAAWDGGWYLRAFHDDGSLVGSAKSRECRIDSIAQSWAILSNPNAREDQQARKALAAADAQLVREKERLILLFWPPFDSTLHDPGYIRGYPAGIRENGGQYTHAATWMGLAHAALGEGERAEHLFQLLNPILRSTNAADTERYRIEPYALAGDIYSVPPWTGRGGWSLYTGAAAWLYRLGVEGILGLKKEEGQLSLAPCIPPHWKGFEAWVRWGKRRVHIVVENPDGVSTGIAEMSLDGRALDFQRIVLDSNVAGTHELQVRMGVAMPQLRQRES